MKIAIAGRGFLGDHVTRAAKARGWSVTPLPPIRVDVTARLPQAVKSWERLNSATSSRLLKALEGCSVCVNAAGMAEPSSRAESQLLAANGATPAVLADAAAKAGVPRFIQISSAAVQAGRCVLDETSAYEPLNAYGRSKVAGELAMLQPFSEVPGERIIYRPTSVQGVNRELTRLLITLSRAPLVPLCDDGSGPVPLALVENVAAAVLHLAEDKTVPTVALHPWEDMTVRELFEAFGHPRFVHVPTRAASGLVRIFAGAGHYSARCAAYSQRLRLITTGQPQIATALERSGFRLPLGKDTYHRLAENYRDIKRSLGPFGGSR